MKATELIEGKRYILAMPKGQVATFEGRHSGKLDLADGSTYYGGNGYLRFSYTDTVGVTRTALFPTGADVEEPVETRVERERLEAERNARQKAAHREAVTQLEEWGFEVAASRAAARLLPNAVRVDDPEDHYFSGPDEVDAVEVDGLTIGKLRAVIKRGQPIAAR